MCVFKFMSIRSSASTTASLIQNKNQYLLSHDDIQRSPLKSVAYVHLYMQRLGGSPTQEDRIREKHGMRNE
ncbi:hypothetical protein CEXT_381991 [Caerostris extrusa]|uniref:Uncharacterized protein n=1 Tax=Caerostris extrusa TaxID=172846 RepID=A0AAV4TJU3_CAEEX|nr:hypothetical protein CEXT_381991 [Caerostris extrusa]